MELDPIVLWVAVVWCVVVLARLVRTRFAASRGWAAVCILVLVAAGIGYVLVPDWAGRIAGTIWFVLLVLPLWFGQLSRRRLLNQRFAAARFYANLARFLHPLDATWALPVIIDAFDVAHRGKPDQAATMLTRLIDDPRVSPKLAILIHTHRARILGDWHAVADLAATPGNPWGLALEATQLRALGETGRLPELLAAFQATRQTDGFDHQLGLLFVFAFCGRRAALAELLAGPLAVVDADTKAFWLATADLTRGDPDARAALVALASSGRPVSRAARQRLDIAPANPDHVLGPAELRIVDEAEAAMRRDADYRGLARDQWRRCYVVFALVALNVAGFIFEEYSGGSETARVLYQLGAVWPDAIILGGEWWRLIAAAFLHAGPVHLGVNMLALVVIGPWVEWSLGHWRFALVYLGTSVGSMAAVLVLMQHGLVATGLLVGASGAILGLVGAQVMLFVRGWRRLKSRLAARRLAAMGAVVAIQVAFDLTTPQVSFAAHASGFLIGICLTALVVAVLANSE